MLVDLYSYLGRNEAEENLSPEEEQKNAALLGGEKFYPFVFLEINIDMQ